MYVYRIVKERYAKDLSGTGARIVGGRWNKKGVPVVYTSESRALAFVEFLVHTPSAIAPANLSLATFRIPDEMEFQKISPSELPSDWRDYPAPEALAEIGNRWTNRNQTSFLLVPSVIVEYEYNIILNPRHPDCKKIRLAKVEPVHLGRRLYQ